MRKFWKKSCGICKAQDVDITMYKNRAGTCMLFCNSCKRYPERRSFEIVKHFPGKKQKQQLMNVKKDVLS